MNSEPPVIPQLVCDHCGGTIVAGQAVCPRCNQTSHQTRTPPRQSASLRKSLTQAIDNPWVVLGLLFGVMGPLAIPILWRSRSFSWPAKIILSVAVCVYITVLVWLAWLAVRMAWEQIQQVM